MKRGSEVGIVDNELVPLESEAELEPALLELAQQARAKATAQ